MRTQIDDCTTCAKRPITADGIIKDFMIKADMAYFDENLHEMFLSFVREYENPAPDFKAEVIHTYTSLRDIIREVEKLQKERSVL